MSFLKSLFGMNKPDLVNPARIGKFQGALGTATPTGFGFSQDKNRQSAVDSANLGLRQLLEGGLGADAGRLENFRRAFFNARSPALERLLAQQQQASAARSGARGTQTNSADIYRNVLQNQAANEQRQNLLNQSILGSESLADRLLRNNLAQLQGLGSLSQQDIGNRLAAQQATMNALFGSQRNELNFNNAINALAQKRADNENAAGQNFLGTAAGIAGLGLTGLGGGGPFMGAFTQALDAGSGLGEAADIGFRNAFPGFFGG